MSRFSPIFACALGLLACGVCLHAATLSRQQADTFERKVGQINDAPGASRATRRTPITQDEHNSWFADRAQPVLPSGIAEPQITIVGDGRVSGQAVVDLDAVGRRRSNGSWLDPWSLLGGRVPVTVVGTLQARDGMGRFSLESATLAGVPVPKPVLQELVSLYSRSPSRPKGVSLDDSFPLPAEIRQIEVGRGEAVVVQ